MNWQEILEKMRNEHVAARRKNWSGEKYIIFIPNYLVHAANYFKYGYRECDKGDIQFVDHLLIHTKDNKLGFYATTQCDMLADDWEVRH